MDSHGTHRAEASFGQGQLPVALHRFNWGAFALPLLWAVAHGAWPIVTWWLFSLLFPVLLASLAGVDGTASTLPGLIAVSAAGEVVNGIVRLWAGLNANQLAWERESRRLSAFSNARPRFSVEHYMRRQRLWAIMGGFLLSVALIATAYLNAQAWAHYGLERVGIIEPFVWLSAEALLGAWLAAKMRQERSEGEPDPTAAHVPVEVREAPPQTPTAPPVYEPHGDERVLGLPSTMRVAPGVDMPRLGFGTYKIAPQDTAAAVTAALRLGYRSVDTASLYGNEAGVGAGIRASGVPREEVFVATKVWNDEQGYESTREALSRSLDRLGLDSVDLYLVHWPVRASLEPTWRAMESLLAEGRTRAIGVCNFLPHHLDELLRFAEVAPAVDQVEFHVWLQQPELQAYLADHGIALEAWAPLMKGRVAEEPGLVRIAEKHGVTPAQVALCWILQSGHVAIPKSVHEERIRENADVFDFELSDDEMSAIASLDRGVRFGPHPDEYAW